MYWSVAGRNETALNKYVNEVKRGKKYFKEGEVISLPLPEFGVPRNKISKSVRMLVGEIDAQKSENFDSLMASFLERISGEGRKVDKEHLHISLLAESGFGFFNVIQKTKSKGLKQICQLIEVMIREEKLLEEVFPTLGNMELDDYKNNFDELTEKIVLIVRIVSWEIESISRKKNRVKALTYEEKVELSFLATVLFGVCFVCLSKRS